MGLLLEQPRGAAPLSAPPCSERAVRNNMIQLRKQNKRIIIDEKIRVMYIRKKFGVFAR